MRFPVTVLPPLAWAGSFSKTPSRSRSSIASRRIVTRSNTKFSAARLRPAAASPACLPVCRQDTLVPSSIGRVLHRDLWGPASSRGTSSLEGRASLRPRCPVHLYESDSESCSNCKQFLPGYGFDFNYRFAKHAYFDSVVNLFPGFHSYGQHGGAQEGLIGLKLGSSWQMGTLFQRPQRLRPLR
jgi:hypothetical protein